MCTLKPMMDLKKAIKLTISCPPVPWAAHAGYGRRAFNPRFREKKFCQWEIKNQYKGKVLTDPISMVLSFYMPIPKNTSKKKRLAMLEFKEYHTKKPDTSNLIKFIEDCLKTMVFSDDSQVYEIIAEKKYSEQPGTEIIIYPQGDL